MPEKSMQMSGSDSELHRSWRDQPTHDRRQGDDLPSLNTNEFRAGSYVQIDAVQVLSVQ